MTSSNDGTASLWNSRNGQLIHTLKGHNGTVSSVAFSSDGQKILTGSSDKTARVWNTKSGELIQTLRSTAAVSSVAFSPDGQQILTGSDDETARLWDLNSGNLIHTLEKYIGSVISVAFSAGGTQVFTVDERGTVRFLLIDESIIMAKLTERACHILAEETIRAEIPKWRGCEAELEVLADGLAAYEKVWGEKGK